MKRLPVVIMVTMMLLTAVVTGCGPRYDSRLVEADGLMHDNPDSALALLEGLDSSALATKGDSAYRDLLLTQARYRCYVTATSDSAINRALAYYRAHPSEREKLTRAYIFKGAVMEELGHPDSAMLYYKHAEAVADTDDYFNLGYINMRIASLYQSQISFGRTAIYRFQKAINYFTIINDTNYLISCYGDLGAVCGTNYPDSTEFYLKRAIELAKQSNSPKQYTYKSKLAGFWYYSGKYQSANRMAMDVFNHGQKLSNETQYYYYAILSYIRLGKNDSAKYVLHHTPQPTDAVDSMNMYQVIAEISKTENDFKTYGDYMLQCASTNFKIQDESREKELLASEHNYDKSEVEMQSALIKKRNNSLWVFLSILTVLISILIWRLIKQFSIINDYQQEKIILSKELKDTIDELEYRRNTDNSVSELVSYRLSALKELIQSIRIKTTENGRKKRIVPFNSLLSQMHERNEIMELELGETFWEKMKLSVNGEYNGILSFIANRYPNLNERDLKLLCLSCAGLSPQIIRICMKFDNPRTSSNYRNKIIKNKMKLDVSFDTFLKKYMNGDYR